MRKLYWRFIFAATLLCTANCTSDTNEVSQADSFYRRPLVSFTDSLIVAVQKEHGAHVMQDKSISFTSRNIRYTITNPHEPKMRTREFTDSIGNTIKDVWKDNQLTRSINNQPIAISTEKEYAYINSINSVFYFALLPLQLSDEAVRTKYLGEVTILNKPYHKFEVKFSEDGGGEDFEDIYIYWIHKTNNTMDYFAYQYFTEGGGMRLREATNRRIIDGITFQDYHNYKPKNDSISLYNLDEAINKNEIITVSYIELEDIAVK